MNAKLIKTSRYYVSPAGNNAWTGGLPSPNRAGSDGPLATVAEALRRAARRPAETPVRIILRGGRHELAEPLLITPELGGGQEWFWECGMSKFPHREWPLSFEAFEGEEPVLSGGRLVRGWSIVKVNGRQAWAAKAPADDAACRQLFVNGQRRPRARWPKQGFLRVQEIPDWKPAPLAEGPPAVQNPKEYDYLAPGWITPKRDRPAWMQGQDRFRFAPGDLERWTNFRDAEIVFLQRWLESRTWFRDIDVKQRVARLDRHAQNSLVHDAVSPEDQAGSRYFVENVLEHLSEPGEWCWDSASGMIYYLPLAGEEPAGVEAIVSVLPHLVQLQGDARREQPVVAVSFENIGFAHNEWSYPAGVAGSLQGACDVPGAVILDHARDCVFRHCSFTQIGTYALELRGGSTEIKAEHCRFTDLGAGGVKVWHGCRRNLISDCELADGGKIFPSAAAIWVGQSGGNRILRNWMRDFYYVGISVGYVWGYPESNSYGNIIESNHVEHMGRDWLSDLGGIYLLGMAPGTRVRYNVVHDVRSAVYGGIGIYPDEGSSDLLIEGNLVFACRSFLVSQHYGRRNLVRDNLLVGGEENQLALHRVEPRQLALTFERNVLIFREGAAYAAGYRNTVLDPDTVSFRQNLYCPFGGKLKFMGLSLKDWRKAGMDQNSVVVGDLTPSVKARMKEILDGLREVPGLPEALRELNQVMSKLTGKSRQTQRLKKTTR